MSPGGVTETSTWLRQQREKRCWPRSEMARRLIKVAHAMGDKSVTSIGNLNHNIYRWELGVVGPSERYKIYYCRAFEIPVAKFGANQEEEWVTSPVLPPGDPAIAALDLLAGIMGLRREFNGETLIIRQDAPSAQDITS